MASKPDLDIVGTPDIARRLNVEQDTVRHWRIRTTRGRQFPLPKWYVANSPVWDWADVEAWARESGRLPRERRPMPREDEVIARVLAKSRAKGGRD